RRCSSLLLRFLRRPSPFLPGPCLSLRTEALSAALKSPSASAHSRQVASRLAPTTSPAYLLQAAPITARARRPCSPRLSKSARPQPQPPAPTRPTPATPQLSPPRSPPSFLPPGRRPGP